MHEFVPFPCFNAASLSQAPPATSRRAHPPKVAWYAATGGVNDSAENLKDSGVAGRTAGGAITWPHVVHR